MGAAGLLVACLKPWHNGQIENIHDTLFGYFLRCQSDVFKSFAPENSSLSLQGATQARPGCAK